MNFYSSILQFIAKSKNDNFQMQEHSSAPASEGDSPWETPKDFHLRSNVSIFGDANLAAEQKVIAILESHFRFPYCPSPGYFFVIFSCQSSSIPTSLIHSFIN